MIKSTELGQTIVAGRDLGKHRIETCRQAAVKHLATIANNRVETAIADLNERAQSGLGVAGKEIAPDRWRLPAIELLVPETDMGTFPAESIPVGIEGGARGLSSLFQAIGHERNSDFAVRADPSVVKALAPFGEECFISSSTAELLEAVSKELRDSGYQEFLFVYEPYLAAFDRSETARPAKWKLVITVPLPTDASETSPTGDAFDAAGAAT